MPVSLTSAAIEIELSGVGLGWTDITADIRMGDGVSWGYGIRGSGPLDRAPSTGTLTFALNSAATNSAGLVGYYSPNHANARAGFDVGIRVRVRLAYAATTYTRFIGRVGQIQPIGGTKLERKVIVTAYDWVDELARFKLDGIATQINKRSDQVISTIVAAMPLQPEATSLATGVDTYGYALDSSRDENSYALTECQKVAQSEAGFVFVKGDGTFTFQSRHSRPAVGTDAYTFANTMQDVSAIRSRDLIFNRIQAIAHPRRTDASVVTLYTLQSVTRVFAGEVATIFGGYVDPLQQAARVGGFDMVAPVATTDYTMNTAEDGSGTNVTASFTVSTSFGGNGHYTTFTNNTASTAYVTFFRVRGKGIYDYENAIAIAEAASTIGDNVLTIDMPYQNDVAVAKGFASYALSLYGTARTYATSIRFRGDEDATHMTAALVGDIGSRIRVTEDVTGVNASAFINAVDCELTDNNRLTVTYTLTPADAQPYWVLGTSALSIDTGLGYL